MTHEYSDLMMFFNYLTGQTEITSVHYADAARELCFDRSMPRIIAVLLEIEALYVTAPFLPNFPCILYNSKQKSVYLAVQRKLDEKKCYLR